MERFREPGPDRVIANKADQDTLYALHYVRAAADRPEGLEENERVATPEEAQFIHDLYVNSCVFLERYDVKPRYINENRIRLFNLSLTSDFEDNEFVTLGIASGPFQEIRIYANEGNFELIGHTLLHEMFHLHSFFSIEASIDRTDDIFLLLGESPRRFGLEVFDTKSGKHLFRYLNEAVVEMLTMKAAEEICSDLPHIKDASVLYDAFYVKERESALKLLTSLGGINPDIDFGSLIFEAMFSGRILELARHIESAYGKGSFRELGERFSEKNPEIEDILARSDTK